MSSQEPFWFKVSTQPAKLQAVTPQRAMPSNHESQSTLFYDGPTTRSRRNRLKKYRREAEQQASSQAASSSGVSPSGEGDQGGISTKQPVGATTIQVGSFRACEESHGNRNESKAYSSEGGGVGGGGGASGSAAGQRGADSVGSEGTEEIEKKAVCFS